MVIHITKKNKENLAASFDYSMDRVNKIKKIPGRRWDKHEKLWYLPNNEYTIKILLDIFADEGILVDSTFSIDTGLNEKIDLMKERLKLKGYSIKTRKVYMNHIKKFINFNLIKVRGALEEKDIRKYMVFLLDSDTSHSYVNQALSAIKIFYKTVLGKSKFTLDIPRPKKEKKLPVVLSQKEVYKILNALKNQKHKTILCIIYSAGLRVGEVVRLKIKDIDKHRMLIHVRQGKGKKDRYSILSKQALNELVIYAKKYPLKDWLFPGMKEEAHLSERTVERVFKKACKKAGIKKKVSVHSLRHSFATHLLEQGVDLRYIQELLGHKNSTTTEIYTHVSNRDIKNITSPLDDLFK
ncbi:MAG: site-specific tyrosine recombinase/integron integrase [Halothermotrichaceae bacterium]